MSDHDHDHDDHHHHDPDYWKHNGIRVIKGNQLDDNTPQTPGMYRQAAINKAQSTDPVKVARALEDLTLDSVVGPVRMRGEDHQLLLPQVVNTIAPVDGKAVKVGWEGTNYGFRTDAAYTGNEIAQGTECKMTRP